MTPDPIREAVAALVAAVEDDEARHGGILSRETLRKASLVRLAISKTEQKETVQ